MDEILILTIVKNFFINICILLVNSKILNNNLKTVDIIKIIFASIVMTTIYISINSYFGNILMIIIMYFIQLIFLKFIIKENNNSLMIANLISNAITYMAFGISLALDITIIVISNISNKIVNLILMIILETILLVLFFKLKRFKDGFTFIILIQKHHQSYLSWKV